LYPITCCSRHNTTLVSQELLYERWGMPTKALHIAPDEMSLPYWRRHDVSEDTANAKDHHRVPPPSYQASVKTETPLDIPQRLERKLAQYNASQSIFKRWLFELLSVLTSAICMGEGSQHYTSGFQLTFVQEQSSRYWYR
jgi:hypothetical protein